VCGQHPARGRSVGIAHASNTTQRTHRTNKRRRERATGRSRTGDAQDDPLLDEERGHPVNRMSRGLRRAWLRRGHTRMGSSAQPITTSSPSPSPSSSRRCKRSRRPRATSGVLNQLTCSRARAFERAGLRKALAQARLRWSAGFAGGARPAKNASDVPHPQPDSALAGPQDVENRVRSVAASVSPARGRAYLVRPGLGY
jgi:hypothetical protein